MATANQILARLKKRLEKKQRKKAMIDAKKKVRAEIAAIRRKLKGK